jgi:lipoprotein-releasing system permease protein
VSAVNVAGIFDLGNKGFNQRIVIGTLNTAQGLLGIVGNVSSIDLTLKDPYAADAVADSIASIHHVEADSWIRTNSQFFTAIKSQNVSSGAIRVSIALSVALGISSVLVVSVVQRSREIGILRAMGASRGQVDRSCGCSSFRAALWDWPVPCSVLHLRAASSHCGLSSPGTPTGRRFSPSKSSRHSIF